MKASMRGPIGYAHRSDTYAKGKMAAGVCGGIDYDLIDL
jgi:hypothetical protein